MVQDSTIEVSCDCLDLRFADKLHASREFRVVNLWKFQN